MNPHGAWRLELARQLVPRLDYGNDLRAAVVGGSVARGYSDALSDLEIILYWERLPDADRRAAIIAALDARYRYPEWDPGRESAFLIGGFPVDVWHISVADIVTTLDDVLINGSIDLLSNNVVDTIRSCIPLKGHEIVDAWKLRSAAYPNALTIRFLEHYLPHFHLRHLMLAAHRDNPTAFYHTLSDIQCSLFLVLLAINRTWFPTFKWIYRSLATLPLTPDDAEARLRQMYHETPVIASTHLRDVLAETLDLIARCDLALSPHVLKRTQYGLRFRPVPYAGWPVP